MSTIPLAELKSPSTADDLALLQARKDLLRDLARLNGSPTAMFIGRYLLTLLPLAIAGVLLAIWPHVATFVVFAVVAGFTQNALGILMHEGSHYFFHRDRTWNDVLANVLVCLPIFNTVEGYRRDHFDHHRQSGEATDPYRELYGEYRTRSDLLRALVADVIGRTAVRSFLRRYAEPDAGTHKRHRVWLFALLGEQAAIAGLLWWLAGSPLAWLFLWVLPLMTIPFAINRARTVVEHHPGLEGLPANRTTQVGILEYLCIAPYGYSHHFEHHLAPNVPYYRLAWAHSYLKDHGFGLRSHEHSTAGYLRTFTRMLRELGAGFPRR